MTGKLTPPELENWAGLVPELSCANYAVSKAFYVGILGFNVRFERPEQQFAYLELGRAELMIEQTNGHWDTGPLVHPFGRGLNFQIEVADAKSLRNRVIAGGCSLYQDLETNWYREDTIEHGQVEFLLQDPDGYLLRFCTSLGTRIVESLTSPD